MITLNLLKLLENNGFGTIDRDLFWQKMTLGKNGVYIASIGNPTNRGSRSMQSFELYSRGTTDVAGYRQLKDIVDSFTQLDWLQCSKPSSDLDHCSKKLKFVILFPSLTLLLQTQHVYPLPK